MKIKVIYLARLSEDIGKKEEYVEILDPNPTIKHLFLKLNLDKIPIRFIRQKTWSMLILK